MKNISDHAFGWSKLIFSLLNCDPPTTYKKTGKPRVIETTSNNGDLHFEIKIAGFAIKVTIIKLNDESPYSPLYKHSPLYEPIVRKMIKDISSFNKFSYAIISSYCLAVGNVDNLRNPRIKSLLTEDNIKDLEKNSKEIQDEREASY